MTLPLTSTSRRNCSIQHGDSRLRLEVFSVISRIEAQGLALISIFKTKSFPLPQDVFLDPEGCPVPSRFEPLLWFQTTRLIMSHAGVLSYSLKTHSCTTIILEVCQCVSKGVVRWERANQVFYKRVSFWIARSVCILIVSRWFTSRQLSESRDDIGKH